MSGQRYKKYTDIEKFRNEYLQTLALQANINEMNMEANKTYKETGQLPAVSQMKDTRTTSEILADSEKLKNDIIAQIASVSSVPFGQLVIKSVLEHPLNADNKLLIFLAQRIDDLMSNLKKIYKYGIKGDTNDAEQFVNFVSTMYNDKNFLVAQSKSFMDRVGAKTISGGVGGQYFAIYENIVKTGATILSIRNDLAIELKPVLKITNEIKNIFNNDIFLNMGQIIDYVSFLKRAIPANQNESQEIEDEVIELEMEETPIYDVVENNEYDFNKPKEHRYNDGSRRLESNRGKLRDFLFIYMDFLNNGLPNASILASLIKQLITSVKNLKNGIVPLTQASKLGSILKNQLYITFVQTLKVINETTLNINSALNPAEIWVIRNLKKLVEDRESLFPHRKQVQRQGQVQGQQRGQAPQEIQQLNAPNNTEENDEHIELETEEPNNTVENNTVENNEEENNEEEEARDKERIMGLRNQIRQLNVEFSWGPEEQTEANVLRFGAEIKQAQGNLNKAIANYERKYNKNFVYGSGIAKRRGRPKGSGIGKRITYKESVKAHTSTSNGVSETPRFIKFGKYLINYHKLNNNDTFALKRINGGNIAEIPSVKISKNLKEVFKKMVGGGAVTYSDISKLSDPEKAYLHKISQKSNILDKFDIPAPSKDTEEKDIHNFEVMRGEIMAGNDSKELIKKFKIHIMKLSKNGTLPKKEVTEILTDLLELGI